MMKPLLYVAVLALLTQCSVPEDIAYCDRLGVDPEHAEYENCLIYFEKQFGIYSRDLSECEIEADKTYPRTLYDNGRPVYTGGFGWGGYGRYQTGGFGWVGPDAKHNNHVDALRNRIIEPCMQKKGWKDPHDWEAGRRKGKAPRLKPKTPLPWAS